MTLKDKARLYVQMLDYLTDEEWEMLLDKLEDFLEESELRRIENERQQ